MDVKYFNGTLSLEIVSIFYYLYTPSCPSYGTCSRCLYVHGPFVGLRVCFGAIIFKWCCVCVLCDSCSFVRVCWSLSLLILLQFIFQRFSFMLNVCVQLFLSVTFYLIDT